MNGLNVHYVHYYDVILNEVKDLRFASVGKIPVLAAEGDLHF